MKKLATIFSVLISLNVFCQGTTSYYYVTGKVEGIDQGAIFIIDISKRDTLAKALIQDHQFFVKGPWPDTSHEVIPVMVLSVQHDFSKSVAVPMALECDSLQTIISEDGAPKYSGSPLQEIFSNFITDSKELNARLFDRATGDVVDSVQNELTIRTEQFYLDHRGTKLDPFISLLIADIITRRLADPADFSEISKMCQDLDTLDIYERAICDAISSYRKNWEGIKPLEIKEQTVKNEDFELAKLVGKKVIILDFWASWCGPCIKEMESLKVLYNTSDVEIVGISIDRRQTDWITSVNKLELPWINIRDTNGEIVKSYNVTSVPTKFVIDKEGKIVARNPDDLKLILARL